VGDCGLVSGLIHLGKRGMPMANLLDRITINPNVCFGKPCIRGTRIWVSLILDFLAGGMTEEELLKEYPRLTHEDVLAALAYGAEVARERIIPVPTEQTA
jgi:uncharacterized protein (DUF433 family)